ncbi:MAG: hypothetical protein R3D02_13360 [Hyphomicrobiales bacterium]
MSAFEWNASFSDVERILGFSLPRSASDHRAWWSNSGGVQVHQNSWLTAGWTVSSVDLSRRLVTFMRSRQQSAARPATNGAATRARASSGDLVALTARLQWTEVGEIGASARPADVPNAAGVYRLTMIANGAARVVIGAAFDLGKRFEGLNGRRDRKMVDAAFGAVVGQALARGEAVRVEVLTAENAWILRDGRGRKAELDDPVERELVTAAAVVDARARGLDVVVSEA